MAVPQGGNINYDTGHAVFEATHGTAPKYANQDKVNPGSVILSGELMLRYMGWTEAADLIIKGMEAAIAAREVTYDFERLWQELGIPEVLSTLLKDRQFQFPVERAVFLTVLHRLFDPGSDRAAEVWQKGYAIEGAGELQLHQLYRAMAWLGEPLPDDQQFGATPFTARRTKDLANAECGMVNAETDFRIPHSAFRIPHSPFQIGNHQSPDHPRVPPGPSGHAVHSGSSSASSEGDSRASVE